MHVLSFHPPSHSKGGLARIALHVLPLARHVAYSSNPLKKEALRVCTCLVPCAVGLGSNLQNATCSYLHVCFVVKPTFTHSIALPQPLQLRDWRGLALPLHTGHRLGTACMFFLFTHPPTPGGISTHCFACVTTSKARRVLEQPFAKEALRVCTCLAPCVVRPGSNLQN